MPLFDIDYNALIRLVIRKRYRKPKLLATIKCLIAPTVWLYDILKAFVNETLYYLYHNSQVVFMQAALNDQFDTVLRRITIVDGPDIDPLYIYQVAEDKPVYIYTEAENQPVYIYTEAETIAGPDFIVRVPNTISFNDKQMVALIERYRLPSKHNYTIQLI